jgi:hypothetical protein
MGRKVYGFHESLRGLSAARILMGTYETALIHRGEKPVKQSNRAVWPSD